MSTTEAEPTPDELSRDATHSTYAPDPDAVEQNPPAGPQTLQERGVPGEVTPARRSTAKSTAT